MEITALEFHKGDNIRERRHPRGRDLPERGCIRYRITNKHLLPLYDKPMIYYPLQTLAEAGIEEVMLVTGGNNAGDFLRLLGDGHEFGLEQLNYASQERPVALPRRSAWQNASSMATNSGACSVTTSSIRASEARSRISIDRRRVRASCSPKWRPCRATACRSWRAEKILFIQEKPQFPRSNYAVTGIYLYDSAIWDILTTLTPIGSRRARSHRRQQRLHRSGRHGVRHPGWLVATQAGPFETYYETFRFLAERVRGGATTESCRRHERSLVRP